MTKALLQVDRISVRYSGVPVIHGVSLEVNKGEAVCIVGGNGAGKSTVLRAIMGAQPPFEGRVVFDGQEIQGLRTENIVGLGLVYVPEEKMLFRPLSVEENLRLGAYSLKNSEQIARNLEFVYEHFPRLRERYRQAASTLSGGEQQMAVIGRGLMSNPKVLMLDEPSLGLSPLLVDELFDTIANLKKEGITILLVEQNVREALEICDRGYVLQTGRLVQEGTGAELLESDNVRKAYLGLRPAAV